jgi:CubicO group peptidase (beta-lactamase class C family)
MLSEIGWLTKNSRRCESPEGKRRWRAGGHRKTALAVLILLAFASAAAAQDAKPTPAADSIPSIEQRVETFINQLEVVRQQLGVPGAAIVVAHRDRIVRSTGLGQRNLETGEPVTEDTVFAVGSVTKQFTAVAMALAVSEGKMAFEDHPRRYVPSFHLQDPEADANLNMIDLLAHRSGLDRSDVVFLSAPFTQAELFELASRSEPAARFRAKHLYNNIMVALAGASVAAAYGTTYERFLTERLLAPLGMRSSTLTVEALTASPNSASGYVRTATGETRPAKRTDSAGIAPAGALNSTARDMGAWLLFLNSHGQLAPRIQPAVYSRIFEPHQQISATIFYGLGFYLESALGLLISEHGGAWPGYAAQVYHVPERALSFALLTNQDNSELAVISKALFWQIVLRPELPTAAAPAAPQPVLSGKKAERIELGACGKIAVKLHAVTNERESVETWPDQKVSATGTAHKAAIFFAVPHPLSRWTERYAAVAAFGETVVNGENAFLIEVTPHGLAPARLYISATSFLILREEIPVYVGDRLAPTSKATDYSDYRIVNSVRMPFGVAVTREVLGSITLTYERISLDQPLDPAVFSAP